MSKRVILIVVFLLGAVVLGFYACSPKSWTWHQKLTLEIQTPEKLAKGAATTLVSWGEHSTLAANFPAGYQGEATAVKIKDGQYLFALIMGPTLYLAFWTFENNPSVDEERFARISKLRDIKQVPRNYYPLLVTFTDINDPKTVMRVDPDDMDAVLGCSKPQLAKDFPWRAQGRTWRQWYKFEAYREAILNAGEEAGLPADYSRYAALEKLNRAFNNGLAKKTEPKYMPPPKGYEADKLQLASMWSAIRAKYGKSSLNEMHRQHRVAAAKLRKAYLERGRDTANDCHRLKSLTLEITDEPVTNGRVEGFGFMKVLETQSTLSGLERFDERFADPINYLTNSAFIQGRN